MSTLAEYQADSSNLSLKRGTTERSLGATPVVATAAPRPPMPNLIQKAAAVGSQIGDFGAFLGKKTAGFVKNTAVDIGEAALGTARTIRDYQLQPIQNKVISDSSKQLEQAQQRIVAEYKSGKMSKENYTKALLGLSKAQQDLSKESQKISSGPTPLQRATDVTETAVNALSLGSLGIAEAGGKQALQAGSREAISALVDEAASPLEKMALKFPALKSLIVRNLGTDAKIAASETAEQYLARSGRQVAANLLIKRPIFYQTNIAQSKNLYDNILKGNYKGALTDAAWLGVQMVDGGPIGVFFKGKDYLKGRLKPLVYGHESLIDTLSKEIGDGNPAQIARFLTTLQKKAPSEFTEAEKTYRILQETNLRMSNEDVQKAVQNILTHYDQRGIPRENLSPGMLYRDYSRWAQASELADRVDKIAYGGEGKVVAGAWSQADRQAIVAMLRKAGPDFQDKGQALIDMAHRPGVAWGNNELLMRKLENVLNDAYRAGGNVDEEIASGIKAIDAASLVSEKIPKKLAQQAARLGFTFVEPVGGRVTPVIDVSDTRKLVSAAVKGNTEIFDLATSPQPELAAIAGAFEKAGLSPQASNIAAQRKLSESIVASLDSLGMGSRMGLVNTQGGDLTEGGRAILSRLQSYIETKRPVFNLGRSAAITDIRQLRNGEIAEALNITKTEAKQVSKAIMEGYKQVPLELRGLGDKIVDTLYQLNPLQKHYSRIQAALRYTYNPFFRTQERVETKLLSHAQANNLVWNRSRAELNDAAHVLDEAGIFSSSLPGEAAQDQVLGRLTANITQGQKRDLAGLALDIANSRGIPLSTMATEHADEIDDALRVVVQYPRHGLLASPLARTLNLVFFPMRYNFKVTMVAAQALAKQPPSVQKAVVHSLFKMKDWMKSDEGIQWQSKHADAIQLFNWLTPINSIEYTFNLLGHKPNSMSDLGQLGGLPLGIITQILDGQGLINLNTPYVNPKTGDVFPKYVPQTTKARAATALADLLNTMFTYPGRVLGLPGKSESIRGAVKAIIDTKGADYYKQAQTDRLTPLEQNMVRVLKGDTSSDALDALYNSPAPGQFNWYTIPPYDIRLPARETSVTPRRGLPTKSTGKKPKKVALPIPSR